MKGPSHLGSNCPGFNLLIQTKLPGCATGGLGGARSPLVLAGGLAGGLPLWSVVMPVET